MKKTKLFVRVSTSLCIGLMLSACANTGGSGSVHYSSHYGPGWHDPMYYPRWHSGPDIIVVPPPKPSRPEKPGGRPPGGKPKPSRPRPSRR